MSKVDMLVGGFQLLVSYGVNILSDNALKMIKLPPLGPVKKLAVKAASTVITFSVMEMVADSIDNAVGEVKKELKKFKKPEEVTVKEEEA